MTPTESIDNAADEDDTCGLCGRGGADKIPHPVYWPGEEHPGTALVHDRCERMECRRAHEALSDQERAAFLAALTREWS